MAPLTDSGTDARRAQSGIVKAGIIWTVLLATLLVILWLNAR